MIVSRVGSPAASLSKMIVRPAVSLVIRMVRFPLGLMSSV